MPPLIKAVISIFVIAVAVAFTLYRDTLGSGTPVWVVPLLAIFMIGAMWLFPEAKKLPADAGGRGPIRT